MEKKYLEFNGKELYFTLRNGVWYVALKPICEALGVDWIAQFKRVKNDKILGPALSNQTMQVGGDQGRPWACLPEKFIYGWLFKIQSDSPELAEFQWKCYEVLYDYFEGTLTRRQKTLSDRHEKYVKLEEIETKLSENEDYIQMLALKADISKINKSLKVQDQELAGRQGSFF